MILITAAQPIRSISPQLIAWGTMPQFLSLRMATALDDATIQVWQGERCMWQRRYRHLNPNLPLHLPATVLSQIKPTGVIRVCVVPAT
jgi:hypothetical protein